MTIENFRMDSWELDDLQRYTKPKSRFFLETFFPRTKQFEGKTIEWDIEYDNARTLAPFVSPMVTGRAISIQQGHFTKSMEPAYIKQSSLAKPHEVLPRSAGEAYGAPMSKQEKWDRIVAKHTQTHRDNVTERLEWMAAGAIINDGYIVSGEDYPAVTLSFGRSSNLSVNVTNDWDEVAGDPYDDIEAVSQLVNDESYGTAVADTIIMDPLAWGLFRAKMINGTTKLAKLFNGDTARFFGGGASMPNIGMRKEVEGAKLMGTLPGYEIWVYDYYFTSNNGAITTKAIPAYTMWIGNKAAYQGTRYFAAIMDLQANFAVQEIFFKSKEHFDPSALEILSQSAPLIAPRNPNAGAKVLVKVT